jgi:hypothetical protein
MPKQMSIRERLAALEAENETLRSKLGRPRAVGECVLGCDPGECTSASIWRYNQGCRGTDCGDARLKYRQEAALRKAAAEQERKDAKASTAKKKPASKATETKVDAPKRSVKRRAVRV